MQNTQKGEIFATEQDGLSMQHRDGISALLPKHKGRVFLANAKVRSHTKRREWVPLQLTEVRFIPQHREQFNTRPMCWIPCVGEFPSFSQNAPRSFYIKKHSRGEIFAANARKSYFPCRTWRFLYQMRMFPFTNAQPFSFHVKVVFLEKPIPIISTC